MLRSSATAGGRLAFGTSALHRAISEAWTEQPLAAVAPLLALFTLRTGRSQRRSPSPSSRPVLPSQGKQAPDVWARFQRLARTGTVQHNGRFQWLVGRERGATSKRWHRQ